MLERIKNLFKSSFQKQLDRTEIEKDWHAQLVKAAELSLPSFYKQNKHLADYMKDNDMAYSVGWNCENWVATVYPNGGGKYAMGKVFAEGAAPYAAITNAIKVSWEVHTDARRIKEGKYQQRNDEEARRLYEKNE